MLQAPPVPVQLLTEKVLPELRHKAKASKKDPGARFGRMSLPAI
jgi:hypothetical protein